VAGGRDDALRRAADLTDRALPPDAHGYAAAAAALVEADAGLLGAARARLAADAAPGPAPHPAVAWVAAEAAWLDGQPDVGLPPAVSTAPLLTGLRHITARWAAHDRAAAPPTPGGSLVSVPPGLPVAAQHTLAAWATGTGFRAAADAWAPVATREQVRCLLAAGLHEPDPAHAVPALLDAERLADQAGLTVLAGRARRALRRHQIRRDVRGPRDGGAQLTRRERDVLRLVADGEPTRRIAGQLGISAETVDTHVRAAMRKLGARTRTEAAALAFEEPR
jgi:DNA-binding CsgD family transcriptional regulator